MNYCVRAVVQDGPSEPISIALVPALVASIDWLENIKIMIQANEAKREVESVESRTAYAQARVVELSEIIGKASFVVLDF